MESSTLSVGSLLKHGEYRITGALGQGGFGITYQAEQVSLGRKVAVKEFFMKDCCERENATSHVTVPTAGNRELVEKFRQKFIREARMIAGLDHEHIVKIHDVFEENATAYYVMEYLGGGCLGEGVKAGKAMPEPEAVESIRQIASALEYLHNKGIIHFDVKPSNVLRTEDGKLKLIDFGISKHYDESGVQTSSTPVGISKGYAPLEQYQQGSDIKSFTPATDIYSLGATLYALLSGSNPPEASVVNEDGVPAIEGISNVVMHTIEKAMEPRRKYRPQSVQEFLGLLNGTAKEDDSEETIVSVADAKSKGAKSDKEKNLTESEKPEKPQKLKVTKEPDKKPFPKWTYGLFAGVAVAVLAAVLLNSPGQVSAPDNVQADSTSVVADAVPETSVASKPSESASKPETPSKPDSPTVVALESLSLIKTSLTLDEGETSTLSVKYSPSNATDKTTTWKSSDASVAKVSSTGKVTAVKSGSAAIIATCQGKDAYCNVTVRQKPQEAQPSKPEPTQAVPAATPQSSASSSASSTTGTHNGHEWVDLGLSVKWATTNVGATTASDYGSYFAWGETSPKSEYTWANLKYCNDTTGDSFSKYYQNQGGTKDNKTTLELSDDAARANWGGSWRMPTRAEQDELREKCTWTWTTQGGHNGYRVTSKSNGNSVFLPAAGYRYGSSLGSAGSNGYYWSSSLNTGFSNLAYSLDFDSGHVDWINDNRCSGQSVRPVCP